MIGTEFLKGQGLGNQLFCYVTARCIGLETGYTFGTAGQKEFAVNRHSQQGMYFMNIDLGVAIEDTGNYLKYQEKEQRIYIPNSMHDITHGCYIAGVDQEILEIKDNTLIYGNLQAEEYFAKYQSEIKQWLCVKAEFEMKEYARDNLCVVNIRGGEYTTNRELFLEKKYWLNAIKNMKKICSDMEFVIVTDDEKAAKKLLPNIPIVQGGLATDYVTIKNAVYLIVSNSSFAYFPAFTSETLKYAIAPKFWARHNTSNGYWASEQNIYSIFDYQDRRGKLFTSKECREELERFKNSQKYAKMTKHPSPVRMKIYRYKIMLMGIIRRIENKIFKLTRKV